MSTRRREAAMVRREDRNVNQSDGSAGLHSDPLALPSRPAPQAGRVDISLRISSASSASSAVSFFSLEQ